MKKRARGKPPFIPPLEGGGQKCLINFELTRTPFMTERSVRTQRIPRTRFSLTSQYPNTLSPNFPLLDI